MAKFKEKRKGERRRRVDVTSPYVQPGKDRRTGRDRRKGSEFGGDLSKKFKSTSNIYKKQIDGLLKKTDKLEEMRKFRERTLEEDSQPEQISFEIIEEKKYPPEKIYPDAFISMTESKPKVDDILKPTKKKESKETSEKISFDDKSKTFGVLLLSFIIPFYLSCYIFQPFILKQFPILNVVCPALIALGIYYVFLRK